MYVYNIIRLNLCQCSSIQLFSWEKKDHSHVSYLCYYYYWRRSNNIRNDNDHQTHRPKWHRSNIAATTTTSIPTSSTNIICPDIYYSVALLSRPSCIHYHNSDISLSFFFFFSFSHTDSTPSCKRMREKGSATLMNSSFLSSVQHIQYTSKFSFPVECEKHREK